MRMSAAINTWEDEGGAPPVSSTLKGSAAQIEWAERIRRAVGAEFDRVAAAFQSVALKQDAVKRADTEAILAVLAEKRVEVMSIDSAGAFIRDWQDIGDQVRKLISGDPRFEAIRTNRAARPLTARKVADLPSHRTIPAVPLVDLVLLPVRALSGVAASQGALLPQLLSHVPKRARLGPK
jgi:hypothetical protein